MVIAPRELVEVWRPLGALHVVGVREAVEGEPRVPRVEEEPVEEGVEAEVDVVEEVGEVVAEVVDDEVASLSQFCSRGEGTRGGAGALR